MPTLDTIGSFAVNAGTVNERIIPLLPESRAIFDPNFSNPPVGSNVYGAVNWKEGFYKPQLLIRTVLFGNWFNIPNLLVILARSGNTGQLLTDLGVVQWQVGGQTARTWAKAKVAAMTLSWQEDQPVLAELLILPYYGAIAPRRLTSDPPTGRPWGSQKVTYGGGLTQVVGGQVRVVNNLRYSETSPWGSSYDGHHYCPEIWSDMLSVDIGIQQYTGAAGNIVASPENLSLLKVAFNGWSDERVTLSTWVKQPREENQIRGKVATVNRFYEGQVPNANTRMIQVTLA